jgi:hypothetical protein
MQGDKMNTNTYGTETLIKAMRAAAEAFLAALDEATGHSPAKPTAEQAQTGGVIEYDPLRDEPPFTPDPKEGATEAQKRLAYVTYLGAIGRLNAEEGRGATSKEIPEFAKKAGYSDGKAVNGWNSRPSSPRAIENLDGERFLNEEGRKWILKDAEKLGIRLVGEIAAVPMP